MDLNGRSVLVTGGAVRVGRAISLGLSRAGARVIVHFNRSEAEAHTVVGEIEASGGRAERVGADLSRHDEVERLAASVEADLGPIDVLINNASVFPAARLLEVDLDVWELAMAVNLRAPFFLTQRIGAAMKKRGEGVIVNLADLSALQSWEGYAAHAISKAGLVHLTRVAARALAPEVRVVGIAPGTVLPPENTSDEEIEVLRRRAPLKRIGTPEDVVGAVLYLIGADFVTGNVLSVDGGRLLR